jgi:nucleotide-binding universal stress UspA family protein
MTSLLFPTDFSTHTTAALDWVRLFAKQTGATITLLHVYQPVVPDTTLPTVGDPGLGTLTSLELEDIGRQQLVDLEATLIAEGFSVKAEWRIGSIEDEILETARVLQSDLIVMGRSDLSTFFDRLAGSAVSDVAEGATCPVLIIPMTDEGGSTRPAEVKTIAYAMQPKTNQSDVAQQTDWLIDMFGATLVVLTEEKLQHNNADMVVMQLYPSGGFLDNLLHPNKVSALVEKSDVPLLIYHQPK